MTPATTNLATPQPETAWSYVVELSGIAQAFQDFIARWPARTWAEGPDDGKARPPSPAHHLSGWFQTPSPWLNRRQLPRLPTEGQASTMDLTQPPGQVHQACPTAKAVTTRLCRAQRDRR